MKTLKQIREKIEKNKEPKSHFEVTYKVGPMTMRKTIEAKDEKEARNHVERKYSSMITTINKVKK